MLEHLTSVCARARLCAVCAVEVLQRVLIIVCDLVLICMAGLSLVEDKDRRCDENLHLYGALCVGLCVLDLYWECMRCSMESALDRLQRDFAPFVSEEGVATNENLLQNQGPVGSPQADLDEARNRGFGSPSPGGTAGGALGRGVRKEKEQKRRRTVDLHCWSIAFSCLVSVLFSFLSAHDLDCAIHVPSLYGFIRSFTYVFIFRLGALLVWVCCRTVKDYEDAAKASGRLVSQPAIQLAAV